MTDYTEKAYIIIDRTKEIRCQNVVPDKHDLLKTRICNKMFGLGELGEGGKIEFKCTRCKKFARFEVI